MEKLAISRILARRMGGSFRLGRSWGQRMREKIPRPMPETYWERMVASAAPATPRSRPTTNHRSRTMFNRAEMAKKTSGVTESPTARR